MVLLPNWRGQFSVYTVHGPAEGIRVNHTKSVRLPEEQAVEGRGLEARYPGFLRGRDIRQRRIARAGADRIGLDDAAPDLRNEGQR